MLRYALYARKSDDDRKVTEKSIAEQVAVLREAEQRHGLSVVARYEESKSAKVPGQRPLFLEMVQRVKRGEINAILCWNVNRLVRNMEEGGLLSQLLIDGHIQEIRTPFEAHKSGDNILPLVLQAATSTQYSLELVQSVSRGMRGHFEQGGVNYRARQGYRNLRDPDNPRRGIVVPDEPRYSLIRKGFDMLLTGAYGVNHVVKTLNETYGYRTRKTERMGGGPLSRSHAYLIFRDPFYAGYVRYKGELKRGLHPPLLTDAEFARVQELLTTQSRPVKRTTERRFAYTALMRCGHCGAQVTAEFHRLKDGRPYIFYRCTTSRGGCTKQGMSEAKLEAAFAAELDRITVDEELCHAALQNIVTSLEAKNAEIGKVYEQQQTALQDVEQQLGRLEEMWLSGMMTDRARYQEREGTLRADRERLLIRAEASRFGLEQARETAHNAAHFVMHARNAFQQATPEQKREIVVALAETYRFFGPERRLEIDLEPILAELVRYAQRLQKAPATLTTYPVVQLGRKGSSRAVEPAISGSYSTKTASLRETVFAGSPGETGVEVPEPLIQALASGSFPKLSLAGGSS